MIFGHPLCHLVQYSTLKPTMPRYREAPWCRVPVEIWTYIMSIHLSGEDFICMDPDPLRDAVNIPAVLARWHNPDSAKCLVSRRRNIRLVCKAWRDATARIPLPYVTLTSFFRYDKEVSSSKALRIRQNTHSIPYGLLMECKCEGRLNEENEGWEEVVHGESTLDVEILMNFGAISIKSLGRSSTRFPRLRALVVRDHPRQSSFLKFFPNLLLLDLTVILRPSRGSNVKREPFLFNKLTTLHLRLWNHEFFSDTENLWIVPNLRHLQVTARTIVPIRPRDWDLCVRMFGETLVSLMFDFGEEEEDPIIGHNAWNIYRLDSQFWGQLPNLRYLAANLQIFRFQPPRQGHPLCALIDTSSPTNDSFDEMKTYMESWKQLRTVSLAFSWAPLEDTSDFPTGFGIAYRKDGQSPITLVGVIALRLQSYCRKTGVRLEDRWGRTLEEWRENPFSGFY